MYAVTFAVSPDHGLSMEQIEEMRSALREFLRERLASYFPAGERFRDREDIAFVPTGKPALTPAGAEKFRRILEGRLNTKFIDASLSAGIMNPFDLTLLASTVQRLGGFALMPQPSHPDLRLLNPRATPSTTLPHGIRATFVWSKADGGDLFRKDLEFKGIDDLAAFVKTINDWTSQSIASGQAEPPTHTGVEFLRRLCDDHRRDRGPDHP